MRQVFDSNTFQFIHGTIMETKGATQPGVNRVRLRFGDICTKNPRQAKLNLAGDFFRKQATVFGQLRPKFGNGFDTPANLFRIELSTRAYVHEVVTTRPRTLDAIGLHQDSTSIIQELRRSGYLQHKRPISTTMRGLVEGG